MLILCKLLNCRQAITRFDILGTLALARIPPFSPYPACSPALLARGRAGSKPGRGARGV